jgi:hypothetical protein
MHLQALWLRLTTHNKLCLIIYYISSCTATFAAIKLLLRQSVALDGALAKAQACSRALQRLKPVQQRDVVRAGACSAAVARSNWPRGCPKRV